MTLKRRETGEWLKQHDPSNKDNPNEFNPGNNKQDALSRIKGIVDVSVDGESYSTTSLNQDITDSEGNLISEEAPLLPDEALEEVMVEEDLANHNLETPRAPAVFITPEEIVAIREEKKAEIGDLALLPEDFDDEED